MSADTIAFYAAIGIIIVAFFIAIYYAIKSLG